MFRPAEPSALQLMRQSPTPGSGTLISRISTKPPQLYQRVAHSDRSTAFGFRWLGVKGLGTDANALSERPPDRAAVLDFLGVLGAERHFSR